MIPTFVVTLRRKWGPEKRLEFSNFWREQISQIVGIDAAKDAQAMTLAVSCGMQEAVFSILRPGPC